MMKSIWVICLTILINIGCRQEASYFDFGTLDGEMYTNSYFDCSLQIPVGWAAQAQGESEWKAQNGYFDEVTNTVQEDVKADVRDVVDAILLVVMERDPEEGNIPASITLMAESLIYNEEVKDARSYLEFSKAEIIDMGTFRIPTNEYQELQTKGEKFLIMDAILDVDEQVIYQSFASLIKNKFAMSAILTHSTESQKEAMMDILRKMEFYE